MLPLNTEWVACLLATLTQPLKAQVGWQMVVEIVSQQLENNSLGHVSCNIGAIYYFQSGLKAEEGYSALVNRFWMQKHLSIKINIIQSINS